MATLIGSVIVFLLVILIHEFGHFIVAKISGIKVLEFSIGMGPKIYQWGKYETRYSLRVLPVGGYVALEGEDSSSDDIRSFSNASLLKRIAVVVAGAIMNFLLAIIAFFIIFSITGYASNEIDSVVENSPAYYSGIRKDDKIIELNGTKIEYFTDIISQIEKSKDKEIDLKVDRNGSINDFKIKPKYSEKENRYIIGFKSKVKKSIAIAFKNAIIYTFNIVVAILNSLKLLITGQFGLDALSGPVGVITEIGRQTSLGVLNLIQILAIISVNLGVMNLLPIPALDGGKLLFLIIEGIRGKKVSIEFEQKMTMIGFSLLIGLMLYVTVFNDISRIVGK